MDKDKLAEKITELGNSGKGGFGECAIRATVAYILNNFTPNKEVERDYVKKQIWSKDKDGEWGCKDIAQEDKPCEHEWVRYDCPNNGHDNDRRVAQIMLVVGMEYEVDRREVGNWHTDIYLKAFPEISFNSVLFSGIDKPDEVPNVPVEVFRITPAYKTLPEDRKKNALNLLADWAKDELEKLQPEDKQPELPPIPEKYSEKDFHTLSTVGIYAPLLLAQAFNKLIDCVRDLRGRDKRDY